MKYLGALLGYFLVNIFFLQVVDAQTNKVCFSLLSAKEKELQVKVTYPDYTTQPVDIEGVIYQRLFMQGAFPILEAGSPELLLCSKSIIVPKGKIEIMIENVEYEIVNNFLLAPSKGEISSQEALLVPFIKSNIYAENRYIEPFQAQTGTYFHLRDFRGTNIYFMPFAYNPVEKKLKVYKSMIIKIISQFSLQPDLPLKNNTDFETVYSQHFINYQADRHKYTSLMQAGEMLVIVPDDFVNAVKPLIEWKIQCGIPTTLTPLSQITDTADHSPFAYIPIKKYIQNFYENHNLLYVVLVGDNEQMPTAYTTDLQQIAGVAADNYYACLNENSEEQDWTFDIIIGRICAKKPEEVSLIVQKSIDYEKNPPISEHFSKFLGIGSNEGEGYGFLGNADWEHIQLIDSMLYNSTYTDGYELLDGEHGKWDKSGNPNAEDVVNVFNSGVGVINYAGHGDNDRLTTSRFGKTDVDKLTNYNCLPFVITTACVTGNYVNNTSLAESLLLAKKDGQPTGAVAVLMSTQPQTWAPPMAGQFEMNRILAQNSIQQPQNLAFGNIVFNGIRFMRESYPFNSLETSLTWLIFGDPSLMLRTQKPKVILADYNPCLPLDATQFRLLSPANGAKVTISLNNQILTTQTISNGSADIHLLKPLQLTDTAIVTIILYNHIPFIGKLFTTQTENNSNLLKIYPNPTSSQLKIINYQLKDGENVEIIDILGRVQQSKIINQQSEIILDVSHLPRGMYFIKIGNWRGKFVVN
ncbi:MAG: C25 family cysteine peptidase [Bacteroidales bacterium]|jgi:gingipain R|nr:C25 family cysteine peptidase [Bacteroidales bacterium]